MVHEASGKGNSNHEKQGTGTGVTIAVEDFQNHANIHLTRGAVL